MAIVYYVGGKIVGLEADTKPTNVPENTTFIESDTATEYIFVSGVWEKIQGIVQTIHTAILTQNVAAIDRYIGIDVTGPSQPSEANAQSALGYDAEYTHYSTTIVSNTMTGTVTHTMRKNSVNMGTAVTYAAGETGTKQASQSVSILSTDLINNRFTNVGTGVVTQPVTFNFTEEH